MPDPTIFDPATLTAAIVGAYGLLNNPMIKRVLEHAADAASEEGGKQALMAGAKLLKKQLGRVINGIKVHFGADAAQKLETLQNVPDAQPHVIQAISQAVQASPQVESEELAELLEEIQALREETEKLSRQMQHGGSIHVVKTEGDFSPVTTGDNSGITMTVGYPEK